MTNGRRAYPVPRAVSGTASAALTNDPVLDLARESARSGRVHESQLPVLASCSWSIGAEWASGVLEKESTARSRRADEVLLAAGYDPDKYMYHGVLDPGYPDHELIVSVARSENGDPSSLEKWDGLDWGAPEESPDGLDFLVLDQDVLADVLDAINTGSGGVMLRPFNPKAWVKDGPVMDYPVLSAAAPPRHTGVMVAFYPDEDLAAALVQDEGEALEDLHMTLAYLGDSEEEVIDYPALQRAVAKWARRMTPISGVISGVGTFTAGTDPVTYASVDIPQLPEAREMLVKILESEGLHVKSNHGYTPHITLAYEARDDVEVGNEIVQFEGVTVKYADDVQNYYLGEPVLAAGGPGPDPVYAIVDEFDTGAVLDLVRVMPGPVAYRRVDGKWTKDKDILAKLMSVDPPPVIKVAPEQLPDVLTQVDTYDKAHAKDKPKDAKPVTAAAWNQSLHPRDRLGQFLEKFDTVNLFGLRTSKDPIAQGEVVGNSQVNDTDYLQVKLQNGTVRGIRADLTEAAPEVKAKLDGDTFPDPDPLDIPVYEVHDPNPDVPTAYPPGEPIPGTFYEGKENLTEAMTYCAKGHRHWGTLGAAGMLIRHTDRDGTVRYLLQKRSPYVQHGGTWSVPGGAILPGDTPLDTGIHETEEEIGAIPDVKPVRAIVVQHGGWAYTTIIADAPHMFEPEGSGSTEWESSGTDWLTADELADVKLHPGFASTWPIIVESEGMIASGALQAAGLWAEDKHPRAAGKFAKKSGGAAPAKKAAAPAPGRGPARPAQGPGRGPSAPRAAAQPARAPLGNLTSSDVHSQPWKLLAVGGTGTPNKLDIPMPDGFWDKQPAGFQSWLNGFLRDHRPEKAKKTGKKSSNTDGKDDRNQAQKKADKKVQADNKKSNDKKNAKKRSRPSWWADVPPQYRAAMRSFLNEASKLTQGQGPAAAAQARVDAISSPQQRAKHLDSADRRFDEAFAKDGLSESKRREQFDRELVDMQKRLHRSGANADGIARLIRQKAAEEKRRREAFAKQRKIRAEQERVRRMTAGNREADQQNRESLDAPQPVRADASMMPSKLKEYWLGPKGRAKVRWGTGGDFNRCVRALGKYLKPERVKGACANLHKLATGQWPGKGKNH